MTPPPPATAPALQAELQRHRAAIDVILRRLRHQQLSEAERAALMRTLARHRAESRKLEKELDGKKTGGSLIEKNLRRGSPPRIPDRAVRP